MMRRRIIVPLVLAAPLVGLLAPMAADAGVLVSAPPKIVCLGKTIRPGVRWDSKGSRWYRVTITDPSTRVVFDRQGTAGTKWRYWRFRPGRTGKFKTIYRGRRGGGTFKISYSTSVKACTTGFVLEDDDYGVFMLSMPQGAPGSSASGCHRVTYAGSGAAEVRLYGTTTGTGLDEYLDLTVTRGTLSGSSATCGGFTADATDYMGAGPGVIFQGTLADFPDDFTGGLLDPSGAAPDQWTNGDYHAYRLVAALRDENGAQGLAAGQSFVWEARSP